MSKSVLWVAASMALLVACSSGEKVSTPGGSGAGGQSGSNSPTGGAPLASGAASTGTNTVGVSGATSSSGATGATQAGGAPGVGGSGGFGGVASSASGGQIIGLGATSGAGGSSFGSGGFTSPLETAGMANSGGSSTTPPECQPGEKRCAGAEPILQSCGADGHFQSTSCEFVCRSGGCTGVCKPGERRCSDTQPQRCNDFGEFVADGPACNAQCEKGTCTGSCRNGATQCTTSSSLQTCRDGAWSPSSECEFTCVNGACGGVCDPGSRRCFSGTQSETCSSTGEWGNRTSCNFVCVNNTCGGECRPGDKRCTGTNLETCNNQGQWAVSESCPNACVNKACGGECRPGSKRCGAANASLETCDGNGKWVQSTCPGACANGSCVTCTQGATECVGTTKIRTCGSNNQWGQATECQFACVGNACGGACKPGARECTAPGAARYRACNDQGSWSTTTCSDTQSCKAGSCGSYPRVVFVTSEVYNGNLGGIAGADKKCQDLAKKANLTGTFKAFLGEPGKPLRDRMNAEGGPFVLVDKKTVVAYNFNDLDSDSLNPVKQTEKGLKPPATVMPPLQAAQDRLITSCDEFVSGLVWVNSLGVSSESRDICKGFTFAGNSEVVDDANFGSWLSTEDWTFVCSPTRTGLCATKAPLFCIEQ
ncbi:MAG TPA: hypothetical protein VFQ61_24565 [Polyangiaceae bacterium]|nr:hypothetical protein [Polyangiaceae bacterium]